MPNDDRDFDQRHIGWWKFVITLLVFTFLGLCAISMTPTWNSWEKSSPKYAQATSASSRGRPAAQKTISIQKGGQISFSLSDPETGRYIGILSIVNGQPHVVPAEGLTVGDLFETFNGKAFYLYRGKKGFTSVPIYKVEFTINSTKLTNVSVKKCGVVAC